MEPRAYFEDWPAGAPVEARLRDAATQARVLAYRQLLLGLTRRLEQRPVTNALLADRAGVHRNTVSRALQGRAFISADILAVLAQQVGLTLSLAEEGRTLEQGEQERRWQRQERNKAAAEEEAAISDARYEALVRRLDASIDLSRQIFDHLAATRERWARDPEDGPLTRA